MNLEQLILPGFEHLDPFNFDHLVDPIEWRDYLVDSATLPEHQWYRTLYNITKERPAEGNSCPRCYSKRVKISYPYIRCHTCKLTEPLIDYTASALFLDYIKQLYK